MPDSNKAILKAVYQQWHDTRGGSVEQIMQVCDDCISFGSIAEGAAPASFTARVAGKQNLHAYFGGLLNEWSMQHYTVHDMVAEGDRVVVISTTAWTNKATGKTVETPKVDVWRFNDGRATEFYEYFDTARMFAAATPD